MLQKLTLERLDLGALVETANQTMDEIATDAINRPHLDKARTMTITLKITPKVEDSQAGHGNQTVEPEIDWEIKHTVPGRSGRTTRAFVNKTTGELAISDNDPFETPRQPNFLGSDKKENA